MVVKMTVNELVKKLIELQKEDYGKLNVVFRDETMKRGLSRVGSCEVIVDNDRIGKFVVLGKPLNDD